MFRSVMAIIRFLQRLRRVYISEWGRIDEEISMHQSIAYTFLLVMPEIHFL